MRRLPYQNPEAPPFQVRPGERTVQPYNIPARLLGLLPGTPAYVFESGCGACEAGSVVDYQWDWTRGAAPSPLMYELLGYLRSLWGSRVQPLPARTSPQLGSWFGELLDLWQLGCRISIDELAGVVLDHAMRGPYAIAQAIEKYTHQMCRAHGKAEFAPPGQLPPPPPGPPAPPAQDVVTYADAPAPRPAPRPAPAPDKLHWGWIVGGAGAFALAIGGVAYAVTRPTRRRARA